MGTPILLSYINMSGEDIPPYAPLQLAGTTETSLGYPVIQVIKPDGHGHAFAIDDGKGASASDDGAFGTCIIPFGCCVWLSYDLAAPATAWQSTVGPVADSWFAGSGNEWLYAGLTDLENERLLVTKMASSGGALVLFELSDVNGTDHFATGTPLLAGKGHGLPAEPCFIVDNMCCWLTGNPRLLEGQLAWCEEVDEPPEDPPFPCGTVVTPDGFTSRWSIVSMCNLGNNCG